MRARGGDLERSQSKRLRETESKRCRVRGGNLEMGESVRQIATESKGQMTRDGSGWTESRRNLPTTTKKISKKNELI